MMSVISMETLAQTHLPSKIIAESGITSLLGLDVGTVEWLDWDSG